MEENIGNIARMREIVNVQTILVGKLSGKRLRGRQAQSGGKYLIWLLKKCIRMWTGFNWISIGFSCKLDFEL
jgi:hypothetical protein